MKTIKYRFERNFPHKARRISSSLLEVAPIADYATLVAPMGGTSDNLINSQVLYTKFNI